MEFHTDGPWNFIFKVHLTPKYFFRLNKRLQPEQKSRFSFKRRGAFRTGAKIYLSKKNIFGLVAL